MLAWSVAPLSAQSTDPATQPRLAFTDLTYVGGFRLPAESSNGDSFSFGGRQLTFNPVSNSLFVGTRLGNIAEVSIPSPVNSTNAAALPFATFLQPFADPTEGHMSDIATGGVNLDGLMVYNNRLYGTASIFYDANNTQRVSHFSRSLQLNQPSFSGWSQVWETGKSGFVSGMMSVIPNEWRTLLGGPAATGQCCIPIVWRTSWGPAAFAFDPARIGQAVVPASPLLYYTADHATLGPWDGANPTYGATIQMGGMAIIAGTRSVLYFGRLGLGPNCYGNGTSDQSLHNTIGPDGANWCYDPTTTDKGSHSYPYRYQIWAYDLNDFAAVKAGTKQPWEVLPYGVWPFDLPTPELSVHLGGVGYDPVNQLLYLSQTYADRDGYSYRPVIHVLQVNATPGIQADGGTPLPTPGTTPPPPPPTTQPPATDPPVSSTVVSAITLSVNRNAPQVTGTPITFAAFAIGGVQPQEYKWFVDDGAGPQSITNWSVVDTFTWTPSTANTYRISVWARSNGNTQDTPEAFASTMFRIDNPAPVKLTSVAMTTDKAAPQVTGTTVTFQATATGGAAQYKFLLYDGSPTWQFLTGWTTQNTFTWTPTAANPNYTMRVWARSANSTKDEPDTETQIEFPINAPPVQRVSAVTLATSHVPPQVVGTSIVFAAAATGAPAAQYKFLLYDGSPTWQFLTDWTSTPTFTWTPTAANPNYRMRVWARSATSSKDEPEAEAEVGYVIDVLAPITAATVTPQPPPPPPAPVIIGRLTEVSLSTNLVSPQPKGTTIVVTAMPNGGGQATYRWLVHDGAQWNVVTGWSTSNSFSWTPTIADPNYRIGVWVRSEGNTTEQYEVSNSLLFPIQ